MAGPVNPVPPLNTGEPAPANVPPPPPPPPAWAMIVGGVCVGLTLVFFMAMLVASLFRVTIPEDSRFLVIVVIAFAGAIGTGFLGGGAAISGQIPLLNNQWFQQHPVTFGASGGFAALVILLLIGPYILPRPPGPTIPVVHAKRIER